MKVGDEVITKERHIGTIAYKVGSTKAMENRWCVRFPDKTLGDFNQSELKLYNIFQGAKFGDKFLTRDGQIALYTGISNLWNGSYTCYLEKSSLSHYSSNGICLFTISKLDIISKYQEPIDEKKLDELAENNSSWCDITDTEGISGMDIRNAYKAGYRDALIHLKME